MLLLIVFDTGGEQVVVKLKVSSEFISVWMDVTYLLQWMPRFNSRPVRVGFIVGKLAVGHVFVEYFCFSMSFHQNFILINSPVPTLYNLSS